MPPDPWAAFVFFGLPLSLGLLGLFHSGRRGYRFYRRRSRMRVDPADDGSKADLDRGALLRIGLLALGSLVLVVHSGRWLLSIYGVP